MPLKKTAIEWVNTQGSLTSLVYKHFCELHAVQQRQLDAARSQSWLKLLAGLGGFVLAVLGSLGIKKVSDFTSQPVQSGFGVLQEKLKIFGLWSLQSGIAALFFLMLFIFFALNRMSRHYLYRSAKGAFLGHLSFDEKNAKILLTDDEAASKLAKYLRETERTADSALVEGEVWSVVFAIFFFACVALGLVYVSS